MAAPILHRVRLSGQADGAAPVADLLPLLLQQLAAQAVAVAYRGSSATPRGAMAWYAEAIRTQLTDWRQDPATGDALLEFAAPEITAEPAGASAAGDPDVPFRATAFDLLVAALADLVGGNRDSHRLDPGLLRTVAGLGQVFSAAGGLSAIWLESRWSLGVPLPHAVVCPLAATACASAADWLAATPPPRSGPLRGRLTGLRPDLAGFVLVPDGTGDPVPGILPADRFSGLAGLVGTEVGVVGRTVFRPSGRIQCVEAQRIQAGHLPLTEDLPPEVVLLEAGEEP